MANGEWKEGHVVHPISPFSPSLLLLFQLLGNWLPFRVTTTATAITFCCNLPYHSCC